MTKAKELATIVLDNIGMGRAERQEFRKAVWDLCDAVLSEPDEPDEQEGLKGWIELTEESGETALVNLSQIKLIRDNQTIEFFDRHTYDVKESYEELKAKIREAG